MVNRNKDGKLYPFQHTPYKAAHVVLETIFALKRFTELVTQI